MIPKACFKQCKGPQKCRQTLILQLQKPRLSAGILKSAHRSPAAGQGLTPSVPLQAPCFSHQTGCGPLTPPPKVLRKLPPSACPGRVGRVCGLERTGKTNYTNSWRAETAFAIPGEGCVWDGVGGLRQQVQWPEVPGVLEKEP